MSKIKIGIVGLGGNGCNWLKYYLEKQGGGKANPSKKQTPQVTAKSYLFNGTTTPASVT